MANGNGKDRLKEEEIQAWVYITSLKMGNRAKAAEARKRLESMGCKVESPKSTNQPESP